MFKNLIIATAVAATLGTAGVASADGNHRHNPHDDGYRHHHAPAKPWAHNRHQETVVKASVNRRVRNDVLPLFRMTGLKKDYRGQKLEEVVVRVRPHRSHGSVRLVVNGKVVDSRRIGHDHVIRLDPRRADVIGKEIRTLQLAVRGKVDIKSVNIRVSERNTFTKHHKRNGHWTNAGQVNEAIAEQIARLILSEIDFGRY
ncbi:MAG: hypothetical protein JJ900_16095 [Rhodospirillales bacterium]|nr:hypothetical protein [Rhodospirillales bacterium]MBO6788370.1 hypothetical protein [Rhodospirillales bacterium]